ncbi:IDEAL domain-containing protein [Sutcliffiella horikoshii]|uniref:IDEAL domain-containing protein n=1 Tax=Sutcliffiella horikoshii TaxID=79883 RepID=A0A5D4SEU5_9BACI|nr:IDEAL domain-containing protein [Sutcliffiella horikoshii]TYS60492.1 IDEAL domain-containing protein [Sutcliffiella horikoshii]
MNKDTFDSLSYSMIAAADVYKRITDRMLKSGDWATVKGCHPKYNGITGYILRMDHKENRAELKVTSKKGKQAPDYGILWVHTEYLVKANEEPVAKKELIDMALDMKDEDWFLELVGGVTRV